MNKALPTLFLIIFFSVISCKSLWNELPMDTPENRAQSALVILGNPPGTYPVSDSNIPELLEYTKDPNPAVRQMAVYQLGQLKSTSYFQDLLPLLIDKDFSVARNTEELFMKNTQAALSVFRNNLSTENKELTLKLLDLIKTLHDKESLSAVMELFLSSDKEIVDNAVITAAVLADINDKILYDALLRPEPEMRIGAIRTFTRLGDPSVLGTLLPYFFDPDVKVQNAVKFSFVNFGSQSIPYLLNVLKNPDPQTRLAVLNLFEALGDPVTIEPMISLFDNSNSRVREGAYHTVLSFGKAAVEPLGKALKSDSEQIVLSSLDLLGRIGDSDALPYLSDLLNDKRPAVSSKVFQTVLLFGKDAGDLFLKIIDSREEDLYDSAVRGLLDLKDTRLVSDNGTSLYNKNERNRILITIASYEDLKKYLDSIDVPALLSRDFLILKEIYDLSDRLITAVKAINNSGSPYTTLYISRNEYRQKAETAMARYFTYMHKYMDSRNPDDLLAAKSQQESSNAFRKMADKQETELENYSGSTDKERELIREFESSKETILKLYNTVSLNRKNMADEILGEFNLTYSKIESGELDQSAKN